MFKCIRLYDKEIINQKKVYRHYLFDTNAMGDKYFVQASKQFFDNDFS